MLWHKERRDPATEIRVQKAPNVFVWVMPKAYQKVNTIVDLADKEVGWMEEVTREVIKGNILLTVHDVHILEQVVSGTTFDFTDDAWQIFIDEHEGDFDMLEQINERLRGCGHSHVEMGVSKSKGDEDMSALFLQNGVCTWFLESRANKKGERQFDYNDAETGLLYTNVPWAVYHDLPDYTAEIQEQLDAKVIEPEPVTYGRGWHKNSYYDEMEDKYYKGRALGL